MSFIPLIGLTTYPSNPNNGSHTPDTYVQAVVRAGGTPVLLPCAGGQSFKEWVKRLDGFIFVGGGDINPSNYGQAPNASNYGVNDVRDQTEFALLRAVLDSGKPVLAICRGFQVLNVMHGGTLHQHLPEAIGTRVIHRSSLNSAILHEVNIADEKLASLMGARAQTASYHHQGIDKLGEGVTAIGWAPDGLVEAIRMDAYPNIVAAVQWHPEMSAMYDPSQQELFNELVRQAVI